MVPQILNESIADKEIIRNLLRIIDHMKGINSMSKITLFKDNNVIMRAINFEPVSREDIVEGITATEQALTDLNKALADFDSLNPIVETPIVADVAEPQAALDTPIVDTQTIEQPITEQLTDVNVIAAGPVLQPEIVTDQLDSIAIDPVPSTIEIQ